ncbi:MAG TPA: S8 family peptidase [Solirubrobacteraceae bacterium]
MWIAYAGRPRDRIELLLTPHGERRAVELAIVLRTRLGRSANAARVAATNTYVAASLTFRELIQVALPLSEWGDDVLGGGDRPSLGATDNWRGRSAERERAAQWLSGIVGLIAPGATGDRLLAGVRRADAIDVPLLFRVATNRSSRTSLMHSARAIKADAARKLFAPSCRDLRWAVVDSGIDARHPALRRRNKDDEPYDKPFEVVTPKPRTLGTRVVATYDFTKVRAALEEHTRQQAARNVREAHRRLRAGLSIDWDVIADEIQVMPESYQGPANDHGTHVAGIIAADWRSTADADTPPTDLIGICPDIELVDLRVFGAGGAGDEFDILAALQFVRHLNSRHERRYIHGVNLSLSLDHKVQSYACGRTPICEEAERVVKSGVVAVAAAGNEGWVKQFDHEGFEDHGYRDISITDPGNAEGVITVGATHGSSPHTYGVSFFSSRGPTGDGRLKPDLVAPGEKITSTAGERGRLEMDGTSQAAPHVSGAAALLMARHDELVGDPQGIKALLCRTATDLGRERYFQGAGMLDVLRAMQAH